MTTKQTCQQVQNQIISSLLKPLKMQTVRTLLATLLCSSMLHAHPEIPGGPQKRPIAIKGATIHRVSQPPIENGVIIFDNGQITQVGDASVLLPENTKVINAEGKHVYPGLFNTDGVLGLIEVNAVRSTDDRGEVGSLNMNVRTEVAVNPDSELIPVTRSGGVLLNLTAPTGGLISGTSAVLQLDGWTTEDITLRAPAGMHIRWPTVQAHGHHDDGEQDAAKRDEQLHRLETVFDDAEAYRQARNANPNQPVDLRWEAMRPVLEGAVPIVALAERAPQIQSAVAFASRRKLKLIIEGGYDAVECAELLRSLDVPVIVSGVYRIPLRRNDPYDHAYTLPARLQKAKVKFCIAGSARFDASNIRNLPYHAAMAVAFGLSKDAALRAITLTPAEMLGVERQVGSLEKGKMATLIVADGEIFDTATNVTHAFVQGRVVDLNDRHKRLYRKYQARQKQEPK